MFGWISKNILSENENRKQLEYENNKFSFQVKWNYGDNEYNFKYKFLVFLFDENEK